MSLFSQEVVNLHTHSYYCGHGSGEIADYVAYAKNLGTLKVLGFSEHCPVPNNKWSSTRMQYSQLDSYINDVLEARNSENLDSSGLNILLGAECDFLPEYVSYYKDVLLGEKGFDYLIGAVHFHHDLSTNLDMYPNIIADYTPFLSEYVKNYTNMLESGLFLLGAHPDLFAYNTPWNKDMTFVSKDIIQCALATNMPLEINGLGLRKGERQIGNTVRCPYTIREFWEMAVDAGVKICCNSDAHRPFDVHGKTNIEGYTNECFAFANLIGAKFVSWEIKKSTASGIPKTVKVKVLA